MVQKTSFSPPVKSRKSPKQQRSTDTVAVIVEAAARILETKGLEGFNTNAVAENAGVSIGSLYQYFPNKHALLSTLIEREMKPLLKAGEDLADISEFKLALRYYVRACVRHQMRRPELARLIDLAERREMFNDQVANTTSRLLAEMEKMLTLPGAPQVPKRRLAAADLLVILRALTDAAGERAEGESERLIQRIEGAVLGYLGR